MYRSTNIVSLNEESELKICNDYQRGKCSDKCFACWICFFFWFVGSVLLSVGIILHAHSTHAKIRRECIFLSTISSHSPSLDLPSPVKSALRLFVVANSVCSSLRLNRHFSCPPPGNVFFFSCFFFFFSYFVVSRLTPIAAGHTSNISYTRAWATFERECLIDHRVHLIISIRFFSFVFNLSFPASASCDNFRDLNLSAHKFVRFFSFFFSSYWTSMKILVVRCNFLGDRNIFIGGKILRGDHAAASFSFSTFF